MPLSSSTASVITVPPNTLSSSVTYAFTVAVSTHDSRSASQTVTITPTFVGSAQLSITSLYTRFNPASKLVLDGYISANYMVTSVWSVSDALGVAVPITSLTSLSKSFSVADASYINFPVSVNGGIFTGGSAYTFRLTVFKTDDATIKAFTEIVLTANAAPTSGSIVSLPTAGSALVTQFLLSSPGWTTDAANFPLSYAFSYRLSPLSTYLTIAASSLRAFTTTTLPPGLTTESNIVTVQAQISDILLSSSTSVTPVQVTFTRTANVTKILTNSLATAFATGDVNLAIRTVNNVRVSLLMSFFSLGRLLRQ